MNKLEKYVDKFASSATTLVCLGLMMVLVFVGTLAQAKMGTFAAQKLFFNSFVVTFDVGGWKIPYFPGGLTVGFLWFFNLLAAFAVRFRYGRKDLGILITHAGMLLLLVGQGLTQMTAQESRMAIEIGETKNFIERARDSELAFVMVSEPNADQVVSIPTLLLRTGKEISTPHLPFTVKIRKFLLNSMIAMGGEMNNQEPSLATQGIGPQISVQQIPPTNSDDEENNPSAFVEIVDGGTSLGTWLVSMSLGAPQSFQFQGKEYRPSLRPRRIYLPFTLTLKEFRHDVYPGTDIPKNFSSLVHLKNMKTTEERDVLIYMNHPLRYEGLTFYQASFGKNDTLSVFQVVRNPVWLTPYISCALVVLGLGIQFLLQLSKFTRNQK